MFETAERLEHYSVSAKLDVLDNLLEGWLTMFTCDWATLLITKDNYSPSKTMQTPSSESQVCTSANYLQYQSQLLHNYTKITDRMQNCCLWRKKTSDSFTENCIETKKHCYWMLGCKKSLLFQWNHFNERL